jgi:Basic region leucine zipper
MALTNAEKQARWRNRRVQRTRDLEQRVAELEAENLRLRNQVSQPARLEWEAQRDDDSQSLVAMLARYCLFVWPDSDDPGAWWWIGEEGDDGEELVSVAQGEAPTMAIAKADADARAARPHGQ